MSRPAARVTDFHSCPVVWHLGGPVVGPGEPTVLIGGLPAARYSDMARCTGATEINAISGGAPTVLIGKLLASRLGDSTDHQGAVLAGQSTVLVGDPPASVSVLRRGKILVVVNRDTHTILIVGVQEFEGQGATLDYIEQATERINTTWRGPTTFEGQPYDVDCMITGRRCAAIRDPRANVIQVIQTQDPVWVTSSRLETASYQMAYGNGEGRQHTTDVSDGIVVPAHEFGHAMGLKDEYIELAPFPNGNRHIQHTGPEGGIMGYYAVGSRPTPDNFEELLTGKGLM